MILAGIDVGTNTIRLLVADIGETSYQELSAGRTITRLGQGLDRTGVLSPEAQARSLDALSAFVEVLRRYPAVPVAAVATSALRRAANAGSFLQELRQRTGLDLRIIDGREEARLTLAGARRALVKGNLTGGDPLDSALLIDIGGGSTELIVTEEGRIRSDRSLDLGAVYLFERFLRSDPPGEEELGLLRRAVRSGLDAWEEELFRETGCRPESPAVVAGTAGTITTLAAMDQAMTDYDPDRINGAVLSADSLDGMVRMLSRTTLSDRKRIPGLEAGREDIILAGAIIAQEVMRRTAKHGMLVSDWGLREGILFDRFEALKRS
jgi:exopolyphosphatase / guanosine-5'-triphosphate,3'-diphosphate pyrophosphatase